MIDSVLRHGAPADAVEIHIEECAQVRGTADSRGPVLAGRAIRAVATVRAWAGVGCALVSTEDTGGHGLEWAVRHAARLAADHPGPQPAVPVPDGMPPAAADLVGGAADPDGWPVDRVLERLRRAVWAAGADLPVRDVRVLRERRWTAVGSTTGVRACGRAGGTWVSAYLAADSRAEPADALVSEFGREAGQCLVDRLAARVSALDRTLRGRPEPADAVPAGGAAVPRGGAAAPAGPVLLRPLATARLLRHWAGQYLAGDAAARLTPGDRAGSLAITLVEDPLARPSPLAAVHDGEGLWTRPVTLLEDGRVRALLHTTGTARAAGVAPNACSVRRPGSGPRPGHRGLRLLPADGALEPSGFGFEATDVLVPPAGSARGAGALLLVGHPGGTPPGGPAVCPVPFPLAELLARVTWLGNDPAWYPDGVEGRSVLVDPG